MGTPKFASTILEKILDSALFELVGLVCQPDKPVGKGKELEMPATKKFLLETGVKARILQPMKLRNNPEIVAEMSELKPDLILVAAYGKIIPLEILKLPRYGSVNVHGSLLPKYRGASPIQAVLLNNETKTGVTFMLMDEKMDEGDIISNFQIPISKKDNYPILSEKLSSLVADKVEQVLLEYLQGELKSVPQNHSQATYCGIVKKEDGKIDWQKHSAEQISNMLRAYFPWPGMWCEYKGKRLKILEGGVLEKQKEQEELRREIKGDEGEVGMVMRGEKGRIEVVCKEGILELKRVQLEGKKEMGIEEFIRGQREFVGSKLE